MAGSNSATGTATVRALRILVELAGWDVNAARPTRDHPWLILEPVANGALQLAEA